MRGELVVIYLVSSKVVKIYTEIWKYRCHLRFMVYRVRTQINKNFIRMKAVAFKNIYKFIYYAAILDFNKMLINISCLTFFKYYFNV